MASGKQAAGGGSFTDDHEAGRYTVVSLPAVSVSPLNCAGPNACDIISVYTSIFWIAMVVLVGAGLVIVPSVLAALKANRGEHISTSEGLAYAGVAIGGLIVLSIDYTSAYEDAMRGVVQFNERAEAAFDDAHPDAP